MARVMIAVLAVAFVVGCAGEDPAGRDPVCCLDSVSGDLLRGPGCTGPSTIDLDGEPAAAVRLCAATASCTDQCAALQANAPDHEGCLRACGDPRFHAP